MFRRENKGISGWNMQLQLQKDLHFSAHVSAAEHFFLFAKIASDGSYFMKSVAAPGLLPILHFIVLCRWLVFYISAMRTVSQMWILIKNY